MKSAWLIILLCLTPVACASLPDESTPDDSEPREVVESSAEAAASIVDGQLEAFNNHDLEAFLTFFHPEIESYKFSGELEFQGLEALRDEFEKAFTYKPHEVVKERIINGNYVIDKVEVTFEYEGQAMIDRGIVIHTLEDGLIRRLTVL